MTSLAFNLSGQNFETICKVQSTSWNYIPYGGCDVIFTDSITILKDTLYNSQKYFVLYNYGFSANDTAGYLREDSVAGKLWYSANLQNAQEYLVMDLSLQKNDTFLVYGYNYSFEIYVDTVFIDISNRKHVDFGNNNIQICSFNPKFEFIEGVGTSACLFYQGTANSTLLSSALLCCNKDQQQIYSNSDFSNVCNLTEVGIKEMSFDNRPKVFPNPSKNGFQIKYDNPNSDIYKLNIYSLTGQIVYSISTNKNTIFIDNELSENGMYFFKLTNKNDKVLTGKIIVN